MKTDYISVSQLNTYIKKLNENDEVLQNIKVQGEVSNLKRAVSGHVYFTLKDAEAAMKVVCFRTYLAKISTEISDGKKVIVSGSISLYVKDGILQLYATNIVSAGVGDLYQNFLALKEKLEERGYFAAEHKQLLPKYPENVGIITSNTGAVVHDMIRVLRRRYPGISIYLYPSSVQGEKSLIELPAAIKLANLHAKVDVLILARGGGSLEDLWAYNTEVLAQAIFTSKIPIISAIGHETDVTIADFVADTRAATPSVAAELVVPEYIQLLQQLDQYAHKFISMTEKITTSKANKLQQDVLQRLGNSLQAKLKREQDNTKRVAKQFEQAVLHVGDKALNRIQQASIRLDLLSPLKTLSRGYAICQSPLSGKLIRSVHEVILKDQLSVQMADGKLHCRVEGVSE
ncbi:MAG: exodeoxyribonuclease VII large subunit [Clostridia bacterium]